MTQAALHFVYSLAALYGIAYGTHLTIEHWHSVPFRIVRSLPLWLAYSALALLLDIVGLVIMLPLAGLQLCTYRESKIYAGTAARTLYAWRGGWLTWLWGNEEDGVTGPTWWQDRTLPREPVCASCRRCWAIRQYLATAWSAYRWSALRNPSNNLRFVPGINPVIRPEAIRSWTWRRPVPVYVPWPMLAEVIFTWQGPYSGIRMHIEFRDGLYRFWWGWKLKPEDVQGVPATDMRKPRCGFGTQFKRIG